MGNNCCKDTSDVQYSVTGPGEANMRPSNKEHSETQFYTTQNGQYLAIPNNRKAKRSGFDPKKNLKHMNSIGSTTRARLNINNSVTPTHSSKRNKRF
jgi:hypothetical protein